VAILFAAVFFKVERIFGDPRNVLTLLATDDYGDKDQVGATLYGRNRLRIQRLLGGKKHGRVEGNESK
jgi:hypothetical protein